MPDQSGTPESGFDESTIPAEVRAKIEKEAREGYLPKERYDQSVGKLKDQLNELSQKIESSQQPQQPAKVYSRKELQAAVDEGRISEEQMDAVLEKQMMDKARNEARNEVSQVTKSQAIQQEIAAYTEALPDLDDANSDNRQRAEEAYEQMVSVMGEPATAADKQKYTAAALKAVFGPVDKLKQRAKDISHKDRETHQEVGDGDDDATKSSKATKGLNSQARSYYQSQIDRGMYKDWDEVNEMLKSAPAKTKARLGLK